MENWGLMTFQEEFLLYCPQDKFTETKTLIRQTVCHEVVHQACGKMFITLFKVFLSCAFNHKETVLMLCSQFLITNEI